MVLVPSLNALFLFKPRKPYIPLCLVFCHHPYEAFHNTPCSLSEFLSFPLGSQGTLPVSVSIMLGWQYYYPPHWLLCFWAPGGTHCPHLRSGIAMCLTLANETQVKVTCLHLLKPCLLLSWTLSTVQRQRATGPKPPGQDQSSQSQWALRQTARTRVFYCVKPLRFQSHILPQHNPT